MATSLIAVIVGLGLGLLTNPGRGVTLDPGAAPSAEHVGTGSTSSPASSRPTRRRVRATLNVLQIVFLALSSAPPPCSSARRPSRSWTSRARCWSWSRRRCGGSSGSPRSARSGSSARPVATYGWDLLAPLATFTVDVYVGCPSSSLVVYPALLARSAAQPAAVLPRRLARHPARLRLPLLGRHHAAHPEGHRRASACRGLTPRSPCRSAPPPRWTAAPRSTRRSRRSSSPRSSACRWASGLPAHRVRLRGRLRGHRGSDRRHRHADADAVARWACRSSGVGLLLAIDPILDMMRTATNVAGQALVPVLVARREGILDEPSTKGTAPQHRSVPVRSETSSPPDTDPSLIGVSPADRVRSPGHPRV